MADLAILYAAPKVLAAPAQEWVERLNPDEVVWTSPIEIDGVAVEGFRFRLSAMGSMPEEAITCQLEYHEQRKVGGPPMPNRLAADSRPRQQSERTAGTQAPKTYWISSS